MRVRLTRQTDNRRRSTPTRRPHVVQHPLSEAAEDPRAGIDSEAASPPATERDDALAAERRWRNAGGPHDEAMYHCGCGYVFEAAVSTSVACPHCGAGQAW
jgi:hypothetical protein